MTPEQAVRVCAAWVDKPVAIDGATHKPLIYPGAYTSRHDGTITVADLAEQCRAKLCKNRHRHEAPINVRDKAARWWLVSEQHNYAWKTPLEFLVALAAVLGGE